MTSLEAYQKFLLKVNKNDSNKKVKIPISRFVLIFNEFQRKYVSSVDRTTDDVEDISPLLVTDFELTKDKSFNNKETFLLPDDYSEFVGSVSIAKKDKCSAELTNWPIKPKNLSVLLKDENNNPSFEWRETICLIKDNVLEIYKDGFDIEKSYLSYYKSVPDIDIEGYVRIDGSSSTNIDPVLGRSEIEKIIDMCAIEVARNYEDVNRFQLAQTRN